MPESLNNFQRLLQYQIAVADMQENTTDHLRAAELNNMMQCVKSGIDLVLEEGDDFEDVEDIIKDIGPRISAMMDNPNSAGKHEMARPEGERKTWPSGEPVPESKRLK